MQFSRRIATYLALPLLPLAGCAQTRCCRAPCEGVIAQQSIQPDMRAVVKDLDEHGVLLEALILRVPEEIALREPAASVIASKVGSRVLTSEEGTALRNGLGNEKGVEILQAPSIITMPGQASTVFIGETYAMEGRSAPSVGYDIDRPNWAGDRFQAVITPSADGSSLALDFSFAMRDMPPKDKIPDFAALKANEVRGTSAVTLHKGSGLLIVAPAGAGKPKDYLFVFVDARLAHPAAKPSP